MDSVKPEYRAEAQPRKRRHVDISESVRGFHNDQPGGHRSHQGRNNGLDGTHSHTWGKFSEVVSKVKYLTHDRSPIRYSH